MTYASELVLIRSPDRNEHKRAILHVKFAREEPRLVIRSLSHLRSHQKQTYGYIIVALPKIKYHYRRPGRFGLANPCFSTSLGRNSSSKVEAVISSALEASSCSIIEISILNSSFHPLWEKKQLTFFAISNPNSSCAALIRPALADAYTIRSLTFDSGGQV